MERQDEEAEKRQEDEERKAGGSNMEGEIITFR